MWPRLITDDPGLLSGVQRHSGNPGKRLRPGEHPRHDGRGGGDFRAADRAVSDLPEKDHGRACRGEARRDEKADENRGAAAGGVPCVPGPDRLPRRTGGCPPSPCRIPFDESPGVTKSPSGPKTTPTKPRRICIKQAIADFQERCIPTSTVNLRLYTDYGDIYNDVITNIATGTTPNVCITYPDHIATYLTGRQRGGAPGRADGRRRATGWAAAQVRFDSPRPGGNRAPVSGGVLLRRTICTPCPSCAPPRACYVNKDLCGRQLGYRLAGGADLGFHVGGV